MEVSATKSVCTASRNKLGHALPDTLREYRIVYKTKAKTLGVWLAAGVRRNSVVINTRLKQFRKRVHRYRMLGRARVDTTRMVRTGGVAALTYGESTHGVPSSLLLSERWVVAAAAAPASGLAG